MVRKILFVIVVMLGTTCTSTNHYAKNDGMTIFRLVNQFRLKHGVPPLQYLKTRQAEIDRWAIHLETRYQHASRGYSTENIAINFIGPEELFRQWKNSPPHRRNMLLWRLKYCAIGVQVGTYKGIQPAYFGVFRGYDRDFKPKNSKYSSKILHP